MIISGKNALINGQSTTLGWKVSLSADTKQFTASNTKGASGRTDGNKTWSGSFNALGAQPAVIPGTTFTFAGDKGDGKGVSGTAMVDSVEIKVDIEAGEIISYTVNFSGDGEYTLGAVVAADATLPDVETSIGRKVELCTPAAEPVWAELDDVRVVTITLSASNGEYVSSSTGGFTKRVAGNLDASISISVYTDDYGTLPGPNAIKGVRVYTSATAFWEFNWIKFAELSDLEADRSNTNPIGATMNGAFSGFTKIGATMTEGSIKTPDTETLWPEAAE